MAILFSDNFNVSDRTLNGYNGWVMVGNGFSILGGKMYHPGGDGNILYNTASLGTADYKITCDYSNAAAVNGPCFLVRYTDTNNFYMAYIDVTSGVKQIQLYKRVAGTFTTLQSTSCTTNQNTTYTAVTSINGSTFSCTVNGVTSSATDTSLTTGGYAGVRIAGAPLLYVDDFVVEDLGGAPAIQLAKVNGIALASIAKYSGIAKASVKKVGGLTIQ